MRLFACAITAIAVAVPAASGQDEGPKATAVLVENFEDGIGAWMVNDGQAGGDPEQVSLCALYEVSPGAPGPGGARCALAEFQAGKNTWASITFPVKGGRWARSNCDSLRMAVKGDGSEAAVQLVLRVVYQSERTRRDVSYSRPLRVDHWDWRTVTIPLAEFTTADGTALTPADVPQISMLQFVQRGEIVRTRFFVDEIRAEAGGEPRVAGPPAPPSRRIEVKLNFEQPRSVSLLQFGVNAPGGTVSELAQPERRELFRAAVEELSPCVVRLHLSDFYDLQHRRLEIDALDQMIAWIESANARPLICFDAPPAWSPGGGTGSWAERNDEFVRLCVRVARRGEAAGGQRYYEIFDEPLLTGLFADVKELTRAYNEVAETVSRADPKGKIGGAGFASAWRDYLDYFTKHAQRLHFVSFHFYATHNAVTSDAELFGAASATSAADLPNQLTFQEVRSLVRAARRPPPEVFVTECAANSLRTEDGRARDDRLATPLGAAWLAMLQLSGAPHVDKVLQYRLVGDGWGLLGDDARPHQTYHAAWLLAKHVPRGASLCDVQRPDTSALAVAVFTQAARNAVLVNGDDTATTFVVQPAGIGVPASVRLLALDAVNTELVPRPLARADRYEVRLQGPGVAVLEFRAEE